MLERYSILKGMQRTRVRLKLTMLGIIAVFLLACLWLVVKPPLAASTAVVGFTFPHAEGGKYPNGAQFSVADLTSRSVIEAVWKSNQLEAQGLEVDDFVRSISVAPLASNADFLKARYQNLLSRKGLTSAEVSAFEKEYKMELDAQLNRGARISMTLPAFSGISGALREKILEDIPAEWARQAISKLGALQLPSVTAGFSEKDFAETTSPFHKVEYLYATMGGLRNSLAGLEGGPGGGALRDVESGLSVRDLLRRVEDVERFGVLAFDVYLQQNVPASEEMLKSIEARLLELRERRRSLIESAETYRVALLDYDAQKQVAPKATTGEDGRQGARAAQLSFEGDALQSLMELAGSTKDHEYRQGLTEKRIAAEIGARALDSEIFRHERRLQAVRKGGQQVSEARLAELSQGVAAQLKELSAATARVQAMYSSRIVDSRGRLYSGPDIQSGNLRAVIEYFRIPAILAAFLLLAFVAVELWFALQAEGLIRRPEGSAGKPSS